MSLFNDELVLQYPVPLAEKSETKTSKDDVQEDRPIVRHEEVESGRRQSTLL